MRTTLNLDDDVLHALRSLARERGRSLGDVATDLIRAALRPDPGDAYVRGFPVFQVREDAPPLTSERVADALDET
ncbi:MAG: CopG family transcriptional regulator [Longimicrobiales bacterium]|nr:CopG family transcriptional regulator [Longimicrobiales bacterium]